MFAEFCSIDPVSVTLLKKKLLGSFEIEMLKPVLRSRSRWSRNYLRPEAGAKINFFLNKFLLQSV